VLSDAVAEGVLTREQADMIGATRLEEVSARDYAAAHGIDLPTLWQARWRAERRLVAWLTAGDTAPDAAAEHVGVHRSRDVGSVRGATPATGRTGLRPASTTAPPDRTTASQTGRRPGAGRPSPRPRARRSSRAVIGSGERQTGKPRRSVSGNGDLQTN
jgi:hypothetical protein